MIGEHTPDDNAPEGEVLELAEAIYPADGGELFFGFVSPLGTDVAPFVDELESQLKANEYSVERIKLSDLINEIKWDGAETWASEYDRISELQKAGNDLRKDHGEGIMAMLACAEVARRRLESSQEAEEDPEPKRVAYIFETLKRPEEAAVFRTIYGHGFFLWAVHSAHEARVAKLEKNMSNDQALELVAIDEKESDSWGQNTRETFELADFYVSDRASAHDQVRRPVRLIFGALFETPTRDEYGMYLASGASFRSADLARQVGAAILDVHGDVVATGCNEVPRAGGGSYWAGDHPDVRDFQLGEDANDMEKELRFERLLQELRKRHEGLTKDDLEEALSISGLDDITEFGRSVHAEMDALLSCARRGAPVRDGTLYSTTFPCHNCARHIVASGVNRVVYIEPYPKSEAYNLHSDALECIAIPAPSPIKPGAEVRVTFEPFVGVAPRRFSDFFSMRHMTGTRIERKEDGRAVPQRPRDLRQPRVRLSSFSYLKREEFATKYVETSVYTDENPEENDNEDTEESHGAEEVRPSNGPARGEVAREPEESLQDSNRFMDPPSHKAEDSLNSNQKGGGC